VQNEGGNPFIIRAEIQISYMYGPDGDAEQENTCGLPAIVDPVHEHCCNRHLDLGECLVKLSKEIAFGSI
jgi:hypothetical protein